MPNQNNRIEYNLGKYEEHFINIFESLKSNSIINRVFDHDHTVWKPVPTEIDNRLGWLSIAKRLELEIPRIENFANQLISDGYTNAVLLGMGGSSLAPEGFQKIFGVEKNFLKLSVLDSTDPLAIKSISDGLDYSKTLFIVATKSGGTVETLSFFKYFYNEVLDEIGQENAGNHFVAITDPGSKLVDLAETHNFREIFLNDPNIGGRYSVLSFFGLVPAGIIGIDLQLLLASAINESNNRSQDYLNLGLTLGAILGSLAQPPTGMSKRDKLTIITSPQLASFGDWAEQLIAESTGKEGKGILPVVGEIIGNPNNYSSDRLFVLLKLTGDAVFNNEIKLLQEAGFPVITINIGTKYDLGAQFFIWEIATVIASHILNINPFDQPNVESAKILARKMVAEYMETGKLPKSDFAITSNESLHTFLANNIKENSYISIQAYLPSTDKTRKEIELFRTEIRNRYKKATTVGFGPRFLHSTGQLHKGDSGNGIFIQLISSVDKDLPIPDEAGASQSRMGFGILKESQALGDSLALINSGRSVIRFNLGNNILSGIKMLRE
jgi:glucose-6-phosphate isomerase